MNRNTSIIITVVVSLICVCCSLFMCIMGFGGVTGNGTYSAGGVEQPMPPTAGFVFLCLSIIAIIVPIATGFFLLRKKPEDAIAEPYNNDPLPPAS